VPSENGGTVLEYSCLQKSIHKNCRTRFRLAKSILLDRSVLGEQPLMIYKFSTASSI
jgi:hypothetical protein